MPIPSLPFELPPYHLTGTVYGVLFNHCNALEQLGDAVHQPPYRAPPQAPVLYIKPRNTLTGPDATVKIPADAFELEIGASLGLVIGRPCCRLDQAEAINHLAGYLIVNDLSIPHASYYRPSLRYKVRDDFCPMGPAVVPRRAVTAPEALGIRVSVDGQPVWQSCTGGLIRSPAQLLADVSDFLTLLPGDVLMIGVGAHPARVQAGQSSLIEIDGLGQLQTHYQAERVRS